MVVVFWGYCHTPNRCIPTIGLVSRLSFDEKAQNLQRSEVSGDNMSQAMAMFD